MLLALSLRDFVLVDHLNLNFQSGFTVLTGETGAGKSITLDAIGLLLGDKADYSQIRQGEKEAQLSALFDLSDSAAVHTLLCEQGFLTEEDVELSIRRVIDNKGKSRSFLNNQAVTLTQLKQIGELLIDIHGQNTHHSLNNETAQRDLLDAFANAQNEAAAVRDAFRQWQSAKKTWETAQSQAETLATERDRLQWQYDELSALHIKPNEWSELSQSHDVLAHAADVLQAAEEVGNLIDGDDGLQTLIYRSRQCLASLLKIVPSVAESIQLLDSVDAELSEVSSNMHTMAANVEIDENLLAEQTERMADIMSMARKYRVEPSLLPAKLTEIETVLNELTAAADLDLLAKNCGEAEIAYKTAAEKLSGKRKSGAKRLAAETTDHMHSLAMKDARFHIELSESAPTAHGVEHVQYQVAVNKGQILRPMNKVASGGELARISLALQMTASQYNHAPTLIFDEVDSGVGGAVAEVVGKALRGLGQNRQVLAVTHLPQVASCGEQHWRVQKHSNASHTVSSIQVLNEDERVDEIARMLGGETITATTRRHAAEMLVLAHGKV